MAMYKHKSDCTLITSEIFVAHTQCHLKAYKLLFHETSGTSHEYVRILEDRANRNQIAHIESICRTECDVRPYSLEHLREGADVFINATLEADGLQAVCPVLTKCETPSALRQHSYEPTLCVGSYAIPKNAKIELCFTGYVLNLLQGVMPLRGRIVTIDGKPHTVKLADGVQRIRSAVESLQGWVALSDAQRPALVLNRECECCAFHGQCETAAQEEDNLSLLDGVTKKAIRKYKGKGIFTVTQLSYTYRPRRRRRPARRASVVHRPDLRALALRTGKICVLEGPKLRHAPMELFLDIEGVPDTKFYYLIGVLARDSDGSQYEAIWADSPADEEDVWQRFQRKVQQFPDSPIYHYGSFDRKAVDMLAGRYGCDCADLSSRLVNLTKYIYGKVYFPVRSNGLKDIGRYIGASWRSPHASGLQSLVWRHRWDETHAQSSRDSLVNYNRDDCLATLLLADTLVRIEKRDDLVSDVDHPHTRKHPSISSADPLHRELEAVLTFAQTDYDGAKIQFRSDGEVSIGRAHAPITHRRKRARRPTRTVLIPRRVECPKHSEQPLQESRSTVERTSVDIVFTRNGLRKSVTRFRASQGRCPLCKRTYSPAGFSTNGRPPLFGYGIKLWVVYQRVALRSSYSCILQMIEDVFDEQLCDRQIVDFLSEVAKDNILSEEILLERLQAGPFIHIDETTISVRGANWYVWVFSDGQHILFRLTETREPTIVQDLLDGYGGVLISDFYAGYDSVECAKQKCWVHLIRDLNNDLWHARLDVELRSLVREVKGLIVPILADVQRYGMKRRHLRKWRSNVDRFYDTMIDGVAYNSEVVPKYQKRFKRYRDELFTFLDHDGIPWHNNSAEAAIRHLALQRKVSGAVSSTIMPLYLRLLAIYQSCRFQGKSFLGFLLSSEPDVDQFSQRNRRTLDTAREKAKEWL
jgi:predicted RecB family nuclease